MQEISLQDALAQLDQEHDRILDALRALEQIAFAPADGNDFPSDEAASLVDFFRRFVDGSHHGKEEGALFPALARSGISEDQGPLATVRAQHDEARRLLRALTEATVAAGRGRGPRARYARAVEAYAAVVRNMIRKETYVLFHAARQRLDAEVQAALLCDFERIEAAALATESRDAVIGEVARNGARVAACA